MKKVYSLILTVILLIVMTACKENQNVEADIWTKEATEKVLLDYDYDAKYKENKEINLIMVKGEYESYQIIMTPKQAISSYDIKMGEFKAVDGTVFNKNNISIYNEKYLEVKSGTVGGAGLPLGFYPDALLPFDVAKAYGENKIDANNNQGLWITFKTDENTAPQVYSGKISLNLDGKNYEIKCSIEVIDYYLSEENTAKSVFPIERDSLIYGELDNSMEMYKKYVDFLTDFRMAAYLLPAESKNIAEYITVAKEYALDTRTPSYAIPVYYVYNANVNDIDLEYELLKEYILNMARESINSNIDLISKSYLYIGMIDEPELGQIIPRAQRITKNVKALKEECSNIILNDATLDSEKRKSYAEKILNIDNLVTNKLTNSLDGYVESWTPLFDDFDSINRREEYESRKERNESVWWYGCIGPKNPYPTYHLDDDLISSRILSWMQYDYNIEGNLYWETSLYQKAIKNEQTGAYERVPANPYLEASRFPEVNGDGFLTYPGAPYGIDGPVSSIRMHSIRDGLEEYELLQDLEDYTQVVNLANGKPIREDLLDILYDSLYEGTKVIGDTKALLNARNTLFDLLLLATSDDNIVIENIIYNKEDITISLSANKGAKLYNNDILLDSIVLENRNIYILKLAKNQALKLNLKTDDDLKLNSLLAGQMRQILDFEKNVGKYEPNEIEIIDGKEISSALSTKIGKINISTNDVEFDISDSDLGSELNKFIIKFYNPNLEKVNINIFIETEDDPILRSVYQGNIKPGINQITVNNLNRFNYKKLGDIKNIIFEFTEDTDHFLYLDYISSIGV